MNTLERFYDALKIALDMLFYKDQYLICNDTDKHVSELSISHKIGHYLSLCIDEYDVDCEYNRDLAESKKNKANELIRPDIIVHRRGCNSSNFVVIEVKPWWNDNAEEDIKKLAEMTEENGRFEYYYGCSVIITKNRYDVTVTILSKGDIIERNIKI